MITIKMKHDGTELDSHMAIELELKIKEVMKRHAAIRPMLLTELQSGKNEKVFEYGMNEDGELV